MANKNWADRLENETQKLLDATGVTDNEVARWVSIQILKAVAWYLTGCDIPFADKAGDKIIKQFGPQDGLFDMEGAYISGNQDGLATIRKRSNRLTTVSGGVLAVFSWFGSLFDLVGLVDGMIRASLRIGGVYAKRYGCTAEVLQPEDFLEIIAYWVGEKGALDSPEAKFAFYELVLGEEAAKKLTAKANIKLSTKLTAKSGLKSAAKAATKSTSEYVMYKATKAASKAASKQASKVVSKFTTKSASKATGKGVSMTPIIAQVGGCLLNAAINRWFMGQLLDAAEDYYDGKFRAMRLEES